MQEIKGRVLIVDDDPDTCQMMSIFLTRAGYEATTAPTVCETLRQVKTEVFDVILLDWFLEDGTGFDLCRTIRAFDGETPIFYCTGNAYQSEVERAMRAGAQGYFIKPIDLEELSESVAWQIAQRGGGRFRETALHAI
jgi:two-component system, OmpR family, response regulator RegX3